MAKGKVADIGARLASARKAAGLTQEELATGVGLDRTAVSKIEAGVRGLDALELARIAEMVRRPIAWFVTEPPPSVISRRQARNDVEVEADILLETLATDVEQLVELKLLSPREQVATGPVTDLGSAERAANEARKLVKRPDGPIVHDLLDLVEALGLYAFVLPLAQDALEGAYVALERGGVALIQGKSPSGRRRFTLAHELGHHFLADSYSAEWVAGSDEREKRINAFAIHFLMPRGSVTARWRELSGPSDPRTAAIHIAAEYGASWTAVCGHLRNLSLVNDDQRWDLEQTPPRRADFIEHSLTIPDAPASQALPKGFEAAVVKGYRTHKLGIDRAIELLRGTLKADDLGPPHEVPLDANVADFSPF